MFDRTVPAFARSAHEADARAPRERPGRYLRVWLQLSEV
jgi:hypothetical protein